MTKKQKLENFKNFLKEDGYRTLKHLSEFPPLGPIIEAWKKGKDNAKLSKSARCTPAIH